jgi:hypothetical protein
VGGDAEAEQSRRQGGQDVSRVITTQAPGRERQRLRRTIAEALRHLGEKPEMDHEARDLIALIVLSLREIQGTIDQATEAWEKRDYYLKAERFRSEWSWVGRMADQMADALQRERWDELSLLLAQLFSHFSDVRVIRMTRSPSVWQGAYAHLLDGTDGGST